MAFVLEETSPGLFFRLVLSEVVLFFSVFFLNHNKNITFASEMKKYIYNEQQGEWSSFEVKSDKPLLEFLLECLQDLSRSRIKSTLQGHGVKVDGVVVTQFDFPLHAGMKVYVSKTKRNREILRNRFVKIVYEDKYLVVVEKQPGILSMPAGHKSLNVKAVLDDYFHRSKQFMEGICVRQALCGRSFRCNGGTGRHGSQLAEGQSGLFHFFFSGRQWR